MYAVEAFSTTALSIMDREPFPHHQTEPIASEFYKHPYGGIARDISVTRDGFMRFFDVTEFDIKMAEAFAGQGKIYDTVEENHETLGYINLLPGGKMTYFVTIIDRTRRAAEKHLNRMIEQHGGILCN